METTREIAIKLKDRRRIAANKWDGIDINNQLEILSGNREMETNKIILQQIRNKLGGYKQQDITKSLYSDVEFVDLEYVISLLCERSLSCHYCRQPTVLLYDKVRDARQWTLDRIDNSRGHNRENVVIACLSCNLSRKTMYDGRFLFTKQLEIKKTN
jgi:5-methylcytosine-specific restriction endonuclease McrA